MESKHWNGESCPSCSETRWTKITVYPPQLDGNVVIQPLVCGSCGTAFARAFQLTSALVRNGPGGGPPVEPMTLTPVGHKLAAFDPLRQAVTFYISSEGDPDHAADDERLLAVLRELTTLFGQVPADPIAYPAPTVGAATEDEPVPTSPD